MTTTARKRLRSTTNDIEERIAHRVPQRTGSPDITDDEQWTTGDFEIITSDHVKFHVPSYMLFGAR
jgi:hypothetical protein